MQKIKLLAVSVPNFNVGW